MDQPGNVANRARGQLNTENEITLSPCVPEDLVSRDGFSRPVPRQAAHLHTQAESGAYLHGIPPEFRGGVHTFILNHRTLSGQSRVYRVAQLRTDGVHCRESAGTGPVSLKVVPNECCLGVNQLRVLSSHLFWTSGLWTYQPGSHRRKVTKVFSTLIPSAVKQRVQSPIIMWL